MWLVGVVSRRLVKQWEWVESMGVVNRRCVWVESMSVASGWNLYMSVASGCGCKEVYRFPNITYPYIHHLYMLFFCNSIPTFVKFFFIFSFF